MRMLPKYTVLVREYNREQGRQVFWHFYANNKKELLKKVKDYQTNNRAFRVLLNKHKRVKL